MKSNLRSLRHVSIKLIASLAIVLLSFCSSAGIAIAQVKNNELNSSGLNDSEPKDSDTTSSSHLDLNSNACLKQLNDDDIVIASIAFVDGLNGFGQFKELVERKPWGIGTPQTVDEVNSQLETQSPFLIITLTKEQALTLDDHRDIIKWVLVQSTSKSCE